MNSIQTYLNGEFNYIDIEENKLNIYDIAHALSNICRFSGHVQRFYSVAEHSLHMSRLIRKEYKKEALLHDAMEAYVVDIPSPLKRLLPDYQEIEDRLELHVRRQFKLPDEMTPLVKRYDRRMLITERDHLMPPNRELWKDVKGLKGFQDIKWLGMQPREAEERFLDQWELVK